MHWPNSHDACTTRPDTTRFANADTDTDPKRKTWTRACTQNPDNGPQSPTARARTALLDDEKVGALDVLLPDTGEQETSHRVLQSCECDSGRRDSKHAEEPFERSKSWNARGIEVTSDMRNGGGRGSMEQISRFAGNAIDNRSNITRGHAPRLR